MSCEIEYQPSFDSYLFIFKLNILIQCCKIETKIFPPTTGGAEQMCSEMDVDFLGSIPLDPRIGLNIAFLFLDWMNIKLKIFKFGFNRSVL